MTQSYTKGSNPYFEYAMYKISKVSLVETMQKNNVLDNFNSYGFERVMDIWDLISKHLENINISLNAYNLPIYNLPTETKPTNKFDFITKFSKQIGGYQSGVLVNDFSYFIDKNILAKGTAKRLSDRQYELLHEIEAFKHLKKENDSVQTMLDFLPKFSAFLNENRDMQILFPATHLQIWAFIQWVEAINTFWNANESLQLRDNYTLGDFYAEKKMGSPALTSYPYDNFVKKYWVFESINTWIDEFMSSETPEIVEFFKANPKPETRYYNTEYNEVMDLYESSRQDLTYLLQGMGQDPTTPPSNIPASETITTESVYNMFKAQEQFSDLEYTDFFLAIIEVMPIQTFGTFLEAIYPQKLVDFISDNYPRESFNTAIGENTLTLDIQTTYINLTKPQLEQMETGGKIPFSIKEKKDFMEVFFTIIHKLYDIKTDDIIAQITGELAPLLFIPERYIRLENRSKVLSVQRGTESYIAYYDTQYYGPWYRLRKRTVPVYATRPRYVNETFYWQEEVEYYTQFNIPKLQNETPTNPNNTYKYKKLNGEWFNINHQRITGNNDDEIIKL